MFEKFIQISCDGCGMPDEQNWEGTVTALRSELKEMGWVHVKGKDYCKSCVTQKKHLTGNSIFE